MKVKLFFFLFFLYSYNLSAELTYDRDAQCMKDEFYYQAKTSEAKTKFCKDNTLFLSNVGYLVEILDIETINDQSLQKYKAARKYLSCFASNKNFDKIAQNIKYRIDQWESSRTSCKMYLSTQLLCLVSQHQQFNSYQMARTWRNKDIKDCQLEPAPSDAILSELFPDNEDIKLRKPDPIAHEPYPAADL